MSQQLESANESLQFTVQMQLNGVIQQLERLERVADGAERPNAMKRNEEGDRNHVTVDDNLAALKTKLMALNATLEDAHSRYSDACIFHLQSWYKARKGQYSELLEQAFQDAMDACTGQYKPAVTFVHLSEEQLQEYSANLVRANVNFHKNEDKYSANPKGYLEKQQYSIVRYEPVDNRELKSTLSIKTELNAPDTSTTVATHQKATEKADKSNPRYNYPGCSNCSLL